MRRKTTVVITTTMPVSIKRTQTRARSTPQAPAAGRSINPRPRGHGGAGEEFGSTIRAVDFLLVLELVLRAEHHGTGGAALEVASICVRGGLYTTTTTSFTTAATTTCRLDYDRRLPALRVVFEPVLDPRQLLLKRLLVEGAALALRRGDVTGT